MTYTPSASLPRKRSRSLGEEVMNDLRGKIEQGIFQPGDQLPTEPVLMAEQGVSRTVIREAISRLQAAGLVETRHGIGTFVLTPPPKASASDFLMVETIRDVLAMLELRISLETEAAGLAALRRSDDQLAAMRQALGLFEEYIERGESAVDADFNFHLQIALATGNKYFEDFYRHLGTTTIPRARLDTAQFAEDKGQKYLQQTNLEHRAILDAIARQDPESARAGMRMHLSNSRERLRRASERESAPERQDNGI
ncbi:MAG: FadR family transcriptional regulator [Rhodocyclales bacterium GT-UBC]|nr:MAG: FadR family transcriptional regulator [Rhodocyclales bacterium GT-UBC]